MENIPSFVFDLLQLKTFEQLSAAEQQEVARYLSREEYAALYTANAASKTFIQQQEDPVPNPLHKQELMERFRNKHRHGASLKLILNKPVELWKVASVILLLGFGGTLFMMQVTKGASQVRYITELDTVYLEKEMPVTKVYDTIYLTREVERSDRTSPKRTREVYPQAISTSEMPTIPPDEYSEINMIPIHEKDRLLNSKKGSSIKDDSLINSYGFTQL